MTINQKLAKAISDWHHSLGMEDTPENVLKHVMEIMKNHDEYSEIYTIMKDLEKYGYNPNDNIFREFDNILNVIK